MTVKIRKENIIPFCPFCRPIIDDIIEVKRKGFFSINRVFCCPHGHKILGMSAGMQ